MTTVGANVARMLLKNEVEEFLYHEAELLDDRRFAEWLDLLSDDHPVLHANAPECEVRRA